MKQVVAVVQPYCVQAALEAVADFEHHAVTVRECKGFRMRDGAANAGSEASNEFGRVYLPKIEIAFLTPAAQAEAVLQKVAEVTRTGRLGDGKIFLFPVEFEIDF